MRHLILTIIFGFLITALNFINAQNATKEWVLVNKKNGHERFFKKDQRIMVYWQGKRRPEVSQGRLADISDDSLFLVVKNSAKGIAKKDIYELSVKRHHALRQNAAAIGLILAGIFIAGLFLLIQFLFNVSRLDVQLAAGEQKLIWPWAFLGVVLIVIGAVRLKSNMIYTSNPFGDKWILQEKTAKPGNQP